MPKSIGEFLMLLVGFALLPVFLAVYLLSFGKIGKLFFTDIYLISLADKENAGRIKYDIVGNPPSRKALMEVDEQIKALCAEGAWRKVSSTIENWDQQRKTCPAGISFAEVAINTVLEFHALQIFEGHDCHPDPILDFEPDTVEKFETLTATHGDCYPLLAIAAHMRCHQGWIGRGEVYAQYVADDGWFGMQKYFAKAAWLLDRFDPVEMNAPLLAAARHELLAFMPNADQHVTRFHREWSMLDPRNQTPHRRHAMMLLPRWFGSDSDLHEAATIAANLTQAETGDAAYFAMYAEVFERWDQNVLSVDLDRFFEGAYDFIRLRDNDPGAVGALIDRMKWWTAAGSLRGLRGAPKERMKEIHSGVEDLRARLIRKHLTAICPKAWDGGKAEALYAISQVYQKELGDGANLLMDQDGISVIQLVERDNAEVANNPA